MTNYWKTYSKALGAQAAQPTQPKASPGPATKTTPVALTVGLGDEGIVIRFPYDAGTVAAVKNSVQGRRWDPVKKHWTGPLTRDNVDTLKKLGFKIDADVENKLNSLFNTSGPAKIEVPGLSSGTYPYQDVGIAWLEMKNGRGLLADEMGLGKTVQAIGYLQLRANRGEGRAVVVCPASLKDNWAHEIHMWSKLSVRVLSGTKADPKAAELWDEDVVVINYDILTAWLPALSEFIKGGALVMDECHYIKNRQAKRSKSVKKLAKAASSVVGLSGTPITNRPNEFYEAISTIEPMLFPSWWKFAERYCGLRQTAYGLDTSGATNTTELHETLTKSIMLRRVKANVLKDLPPKRRNIVLMDTDDAAMKEYRRAANDLITWLEQTRGKGKAEKASQAEELARIEILKQLAVEAKMNSAIEWIQNFIESNGKLVVFATHKKVIDRLMSHFGTTAVKIDGSVAPAKRQDIVKKFQTDDSIRLFVGNLKAAGVGLTLTAAADTAFLEFGWTPGDHDQAEDRVHRIGQEAESVGAWYLTAPRTIDTEIAALLDEKRKVLTAVLDGKKVPDLDLFETLLQNLTNKRAA